MSKLNIYSSAWEWKPGVECDIQFAEYLNRFSGMSVFHFGTGKHHRLAKENYNDNNILAITASKKEYDVYIDLIIKNPALAMKYKVIFGDIYTLSEDILPQFNFVTLFHLYEYSKPNNDYGQKTDEQLLKMFLTKLDNGSVVFFKKSNHFEETKELINQLTLNKEIQCVDEYKDIIFYKRI